MKARKVRGLDADGSTAENLALIVRIRLDELYGFIPRALDPGEVEALHDMRIAAKRLRYLLEISSFCFGSYAEKAAGEVKEVQDLLGEIHDCDVMLPRVRGHAAGLRVADAAALVDAARDSDDLDPKLALRAPSRGAYRGLQALEVHLTARRALLHRRFAGHWQDLQRKGFRARLEWALGERPAAEPEHHEPAESA